MLGVGAPFCCVEEGLVFPAGNQQQHAFYEFHTACHARGVSASEDVLGLPGGSSPQSSRWQCLPHPPRCRCPRWLLQKKGQERGRAGGGGEKSSQAPEGWQRRIRLVRRPFAIDLWLLDWSGRERRTRGAPTTSCPLCNLRRHQCLSAPNSLPGTSYTHVHTVVVQCPV